MKSLPQGVIAAVIIAVAIVAGRSSCAPRIPLGSMRANRETIGTIVHEYLVENLM